MLFLTILDPYFLVFPLLGGARGGSKSWHTLLCSRWNSSTFGTFLNLFSSSKIQGVDHWSSCKSDDTDNKKSFLGEGGRRPEGVRSVAQPIENPPLAPPKRGIFRLMQEVYSPRKNRGGLKSCNLLLRLRLNPFRLRHLPQGRTGYKKSFWRMIEKKKEWVT
jgi:hypothetical protein